MKWLTLLKIDHITFSCESGILLPGRAGESCHWISPAQWGQYFIRLTLIDRESMVTDSVKEIEIITRLEC